MDHGHGMGGMGMMMAPPPSSNMSMSMNMPRKRKMMMHMSFYWGSNAEILFHGWPGTSTGMYVLSLVFVFVLAVLIEWMSHSSIISRYSKNNVVTGVLATVLHALRMGLAYFVMLAVMSFNVGVFIVAILGHAIGFLVFGSSVFVSGRKEDKSDLPPMSC